MKWGVRKAIHKDTEKALSKVYNKAQKKLRKLENRANIQKQKNEMAYHKGKVYRTAAGALAASGGSYGLAKLSNRLASQGLGRSIENKVAIGSSLGLLAAGAGLAGKEGYHAGKYFASLYRTTPKGHKKAIAKRDSWKKEMHNAFKGTSYANLPPYAKKKVRHSDLEDPNSLAHYGVEGMKWGVRKAKYYNDPEMLRKHYQKASKKLARLEERGNNGSKYAARAAGLGSVGGALTYAGIRGLAPEAWKRISKSTEIAVPTWSQNVSKGIMNIGKGHIDYFAKRYGYTPQYVEKAKKRLDEAQPGLQRKLGIATLGAGAGLLGAAGYNAYRAATAKKNRARANELREAMKESFAGTEYEKYDGMPLPKQKKIRRRR
jgi:hypothetical protein